jgi:hypothetical protein
MVSGESIQFGKFIGRYLDGLPLGDRWAITGKWIASELYSSKRLPLRVIAAIGADAAECIGQLRARGFDPQRFEYAPVPEPYERDS